jgi:hypothetical protein
VDLGTGDIEVSSPPAHADTDCPVIPLSREGPPGGGRSDKEIPFDHTWDDFLVATKMFQTIKRLKTSQRLKDADFERWSAEIAAFREKRGIGPPEIDTVVAWVFRHSFWSRQVQSPSGLIRHWDKITDQMGQERARRKF